MIARLRTASCALALSFALAAPVALASTTASAAPRQPIVYDALGDSYASGYGVPPYAPCGRSDAAYAVQVDGREKIRLDDFVACAGATTVSLVSGGQLGALGADTDLVSLQVGGNDIGWSRAVAACLGGSDPQCAGAVADARRRISTDLPGRLDTVYDQVAAHAPNAHVVVLGYPRLFSPEYGAFLAASQAEQGALNDGADLLNAVIRAAAVRHGFQFVDVTKRFAGHGVNAPDAWVLGPFDPAAFHPNAAGYEAYTAALTAAVRPSRVGR
jgi:lysophospholipase L1-like esterase